MAIELATKFAPYVDEKFTTESKKSMLTNQDFDFVNARTVKIYKISTSEMNDYDRNGAKSGEQWSRYGAVKDLDATTETMTLKKDRSFTFVIDKMDNDETVNQLEAAAALERQTREVVIPEVDTYTYGIMVASAGTKPVAKTLTPENIYDEITKGTNTLDNAEVPDENRVIIVSPDVYRLMKKSKDIVMETDIDTNLRKQGVVSNLDGASVIKVPAGRLPENCGFIMCHPCATVAPTKLEDYKIHQDPPGISGSLVEGRICYDAFVLDNKKMAIYYQELAKA